MAGLKYHWRAFRPGLVSGFLYGMVRFIGSTMRMRIEGEPEDLSHKIVCGWHGRTFAFANFFRNRGFWVIISHSNDGEMQTRIFRRLGFRIIRGSTGRGGVKALVESIRALRAGGTLAMTPDGPRGPSEIVQDGVMVMAQKSGAALIPAAFSCKPRLVFGSWDRYTMPLPFSRGVIIYGDPITVPEGADPETVESLRQQLQDEMNRLQEAAEAAVGHGAGAIIRL